MVAQDTFGSATLCVAAIALKNLSRHLVRTLASPILSYFQLLMRGCVSSTRAAIAAKRLNCLLAFHLQSAPSWTGALVPKQASAATTAHQPPEETMSKTQPISSCAPTSKLLPSSKHRAALLALFTLLSAACGGDDDGAASLAVTWAFEAGDCASNGIERVDITVTPGETASFSCATGQGIVGDIFAGETHSILAQGLDSGGIVRVENRPHTVSFSGD